MQILDEGFITRADEVWRGSRDVDKLLQFLRREGISKLDSVKAVRAICQVSLSDAKKMVFQSSVWQDTAEATEMLHDEVVAALETTEKE